MCVVAGGVRALTFGEQLEIVKIVGAAAAFLIGLWQYRKGQVWKRLEFVSAEMRIFFDDVAVEAAMKMLDWRRRKIALFKYRGEEHDKLSEVEYSLVADSLGTDPSTRYSKEQTAIRDIFERFLEYLARFEGFIESRAIKATDLNPYLNYWTKLIAGQDVNSPEVTKQVLPVLWKFIDFYGYRDVRKFVSRYESIRYQTSIQRSES